MTGDWRRRMRRSKLLALAALCLTLAGCSLARPEAAEQTGGGDRKSTRLNSSH